MFSRQITVDTTRYSLVSERDCSVHNISKYPIRVIFSDSQPNINSTSYDLIAVGDWVHKSNGLPAGNLYICCGSSPLYGRESVISVSYSKETENYTETIIEVLLDIKNQLRLLNLRIDEAFGLNINDEDMDN